MPLPNFTFNPYISPKFAKPFVGGISNEFGQAVQERTRQFHENAEQDDVLGYQADTLRTKIAPFENDQILAGQALDQARSELSDRAKRGDYENMFREVKRSARKFSANVEPLLQNRALYNDYLKNLQEAKTKGDIGDATYQGAVNYSVQNYKGYDPGNPNSFFKGYTPTKDISIPDKFHKFFGDNFKADTKAYDVVNPMTGLKERVSVEQNDQPVKVGNDFLFYNDQSGTFNTEGDGRKITHIELAARQYAAGDKDINNYKGTQYKIGNQQGFHGELENAIQSEVEKLGYHINKNELDPLTPGWLKWYDNKIDINKPFETSAEVPTTNTHLSPKFQGFSFSPTGKLQQGNEYLEANPDGSYRKYYDGNGKQITVEEKRHKDTMLGGQFNYTAPSEKDKYKYKTERATPEEQAKLDKTNNEEFDELVKNTFLAEAKAQHFSPKDQNQILMNMQNTWNSATYRRKVLDQYNSAVKEFKTVENELWTKRNFAETKEIGDIEVPKGQDGNSVLAKNLAGRTVKVLSNNGDLKINTEGVNDINALLSKAKDEGWTLDTMSDNGLLKINPVMNIPGSSVTLKFTKGTGSDHSTAYINAAVGIGASDKKPLLGVLQKIGEAYLSGNGGFVPMPGLGKGGFKVINTPGQVTGMKVPFVGLVQQVDSEGNNTGDPINLQDFQDWYINQPAVKNEANAFLLNKK